MLTHFKCQSDHLHSWEIGYRYFTVWENYLSFIFSIIQAKCGIYQLTGPFLYPRNIAVNLMGKVKGYVHAFLKNWSVWTHLYLYCLPDAKNWLIRKDADTGKDWRREDKGLEEDKMVGWHHCLDGHESEQAVGAADGQGSPVCYSPRGCKELDTTESLNWLMPSSHRYLLSIYYVYVMWTTRKSRKNQKLILSSQRRGKIHLTNKLSA